MGLSRSKSIYFHQFSTMYEAGLPVLRVLGMLSDQAPGRRLKSASKRIRSRVTEGESLGNALRAEGALFSNFEIELVAAGETTGHLSQVLQSLAAWDDLVAGRARQFLAGVAYPVVLYHAFILIVNAVPVIIGEREASTYVGRCLLFLSPLYLFFLAGGFLIPRARRTIPVLGALIDQLGLCVPIVRGVLRKLALSRFAFALRCTVEAGVPIQNALEIAANACGNSVVARRLRRSVRSVKRGESVSNALQRTRALPAVAMEFIRTGEESGNLDQMLTKVSTVFAQDAEFAIRQATQWVPYLVYMAIAAAVGYYIVTTFAGIYSSYDALLEDLPV